MKIIIKNSSPDPIYKQISDQLRGLIITGELKSGEALPSIRNLARDLRISVITTKRSYEDLEREGFLETVGGKGTFVAPQNREFIKEQKLKIIEAKLSEAVDKARMLGLKKNELKEMLDALYE
ncbi:MAG TPA: GntR family transcriptional regulator [Clostridiales bacterium]|nr:GntR family transcriptional regulator [Clostridiales bacterium]HQP69201.1 GntR family transcriptional regulator [Clostridiales bacterium]